MLKDRKALVEAEIIRQTEIASHLYLDMIRGSVDHNEDYDVACDRITKLQHERKMIQLLLDQGHL